MQNIRFRVFETNSSSTHSLCICTAEEYEKFGRGELLYDTDTDMLVPRETVDIDEDDEDNYKTVLTARELMVHWHDIDRFTEKYTSPSGDDIVVFGAYGYE